jgi:histone-binding protein RBBP4
MVPGQRIVRLCVLFAVDGPELSYRPSNKPYSTHRLLLGTHTSGQAQDYLLIATVQIPITSSSSSETLDRSNYDDTRGELGGHTIPPTPRIQVIQKINHAGEVNRARYMPQNPDMLATKSVSGEVLIFDRTKQGSDPDKSGICKPDIRLVGQTKEG